MNDNIKAIAETIYQELKKHKVAMTEYYAEQVAAALYAAGYRKQSDNIKRSSRNIQRGELMTAILEYLEDLYNSGNLSDEEWLDLKNLVEEANNEN